MTQENSFDRFSAYSKEKAEKVFKYVSFVISHPHTTLTEHDRHRALELIRYLYPEEEIVEFLYSQMSEEDYKAVKAIRNHARQSFDSYFALTNHD